MINSFLLDITLFFETRDESNRDNSWLVFDAQHLPLVLAVSFSPRPIPLYLHNVSRDRYLGRDCGALISPVAEIRILKRFARILADAGIRHRTRKISTGDGSDKRDSLLLTISIDFIKQIDADATPYPLFRSRVFGQLERRPSR